MQWRHSWRRALRCSLHAAEPGATLSWSHDQCHGISRTSPAAVSRLSTSDSTSRECDCCLEAPVVAVEGFPNEVAWLEIEKVRTTPPPPVVGRQKPRELVERVVSVHQLPCSRATGRGSRASHRGPRFRIRSINLEPGSGSSQSAMKTKRTGRRRPPKSTWVKFSPWQ